MTRHFRSRYPFFFGSQPGVDPRSLGAQYIHLQSEDVQGDRRAVQISRTLD